MHECSAPRWGRYMIHRVHMGTAADGGGLGYRMLNRSLNKHQDRQPETDGACVVDLAIALGSLPGIAPRVRKLVTTA